MISPRPNPAPNPATSLDALLRQEDHLRRIDYISPWDGEGIGIAQETYVLAGRTGALVGSSPVTAAFTAADQDLPVPEVHGSGVKTRRNSPRRNRLPCGPSRVPARPFAGGRETVEVVPRDELVEDHPKHHRLTMKITLGRTRRTKLLRSSREMRRRETLPAPAEIAHETVIKMSHGY